MAGFIQRMRDRYTQIELKIDKIERHFEHMRSDSEERAYIERLKQRHDEQAKAHSGFSQDSITETVADFKDAVKTIKQNIGD